MKVMWIKPFLAVLAALAVGLAAAPADGEEAVALVNGLAISEGSLEREMKGLQQRLLQSGRDVTPEQLQDLRPRVLESLIDKELLYQASVRQGIEVTDKEMDAEWERIRGRFSSEEEFGQTLDRMGVTPNSLREEIRRSKAVQKLVKERFAGSVDVTEEEERAFYRDNPEAFERPEEVRARHILIRPETGGGEEGKKQAMAEIRGVQEELKAGKDFSELAAEHSDGPTGARGGDLGYFPRGRMAPAFEDAAFSLEPGEVSDVVETQFGYHLIKLEDRRSEAVLPFEEVKVKLRQYLIGEKTKKQVAEYVQELKEEAEIRRMIGGEG